MSVIQFPSRNLIKVGHSSYLAVNPIWIRSQKLDINKRKIKQLVDQQGKLILEPENGETNTIANAS